MVLEFGLLKSGLFNESELTGVGLGTDSQQAIINNAGSGKIIINDNTTKSFTSTLETTQKTYTGVVFSDKKYYRVTIFSNHDTNSSMNFRIALSDGVNTTNLSTEGEANNEMHYVVAEFCQQNSATTTQVLNNIQIRRSASASFVTAGSITIAGSGIFTEQTIIKINAWMVSGTGIIERVVIEELT